MFIHFAFGELGKQGRITEQTNEVIEKILEPKHLKVSSNTEFLPAYPVKGIRIPLTGTAPVADEKSIYYIQDDVLMICFICIPLNKIRSSPHHKQYGKLGIVLSNQFLENKGIKPVEYYTEQSLWNDPLVKQFNSLGGGSRELQNEILTYRKPSTYFPNFRKSVQLRISVSGTQRTSELIKYDRYPDNYDFKQENEWRIAFPDGTQYMDFDEKDLYMVITPDSESRTAIYSFFRENWTHQPIVKIFPS